MRAAEWANAASGAGKLAQQAGRANAEKAFLLSPSMRRAQVQQWGQVFKGLTGQQGLQGEVYALATVGSMVGSLAAAKAINDRYGLTEFIYDPGKPGFGNITLPGGIVINPFSQEQITKAFVKSLEVLKDGKLSQEEVANLAKEWGKLGISSASPAIRPFLAQIGVGYDPGSGYKFGDLGDGQGFKQKAINALPVPPIVQQAIRGDVGPLQTPLDILGVGNYRENTWSQFYRELEKSGQNSDTFWGLPTEQRNQILDQNPGAKALLDQINAQGLQDAQASRNPQADKTIGFENLRQINEERIANEQRAGARLQSDPAALRESLDNIQADAASKRAQVDADFKLFEDTGQLPTDQKKADLYRYYAAFDTAKPDTVNLDHDILDSELGKLQAELGPERWAQVLSQTGQTEHAPSVQFIYDAKKTISDSGYWDLGDNVAQTVGLPLNGKSVDTYWAGKRQEILDNLISQGADKYQAGIGADKILGNQMKPYSNLLSIQRKGFLIQHPDVARALIDAGYSISKTGQIAASR